MKEYFSGAFKTFFDYSVVLLGFVLFLYAFLNYLWFYSFIFFLLFALVIYADYRALAQREKRKHSNAKAYPIKGFILGLLGFSPYIIALTIYPFINLEGVIKLEPEIVNRIKELVLNTLLGILYWFYKLGNESPVSYTLAVLLVPALAGLGYLAGYYGFDFGVFYRKHFVKDEPGDAE
jgi:hypothetical protein